MNFCQPFIDKVLERSVLLIFTIWLVYYAGLLDHVVNLFYAGDNFYFRFKDMTELQVE